MIPYSTLQHVLQARDESKARDEWYMSGRKPRIHFGTSEDEQGKQSSIHARQPIGNRTPRVYWGYPEPAPASTLDSQAAVHEQDFVPPAREQQPETQEPDRYQPPAGYSRLGRDMQTGAYVDVAQAARLRGLYIIGLQGYGKSGLIENLIIQDIKQNIGVCVLDPHGELIT